MAAVAESAGEGPTVGVLAIQGSFSEHVDIARELGATVREVRLPEELDGIEGLIMPGGESTAMAVVGEGTGVFPALREFVKSGRPVWGTCAGMILLSNTAIYQRDGGQALVGGLDVEVCRNFFGAQIQSCEMDLKIAAFERLNAAKASAAEGAVEPAYHAVFIRAPAILSAGPEVEVLAKVTAKPCKLAQESLRSTTVASGAKSGGKSKAEVGSEEGAEGAAKRQKFATKAEADFFAVNEAAKKFATKADDDFFAAEKDDDAARPREVIVAARQGNLMATAFHPEFTNDRRWHQLFLEMVRDNSAK